MADESRAAFHDPEGLPASSRKACLFVNHSTSHWGNDSTKLWEGRRMVATTEKGADGRCNLRENVLRNKCSDDSW